MPLNLTHVTYNSQATPQVNAASTSMSQQANQGVGTQPSTIQVPANLTASQAGTALLSSLSKGDSFTGQITNITQNQITIALSDSVNVKALLANAASYNIGDMASFTIKDNSGAQIILSPNPNVQLNNLMQDQTMTAALSQANMPVNETNVSLIHEMMKQGIPIDPDTVNQYAHAMESTPSATPQDTVLLMKMGVPVNEEQVSALHDYYQFSQGMSAKAEAFSTHFLNASEAWLSEGNPSGQTNAGEMLSKLLESYSDAGMEHEMLKDSMSEMQRNDLSQLLLSTDPQAMATLENKDNASHTTVVIHANNENLNQLADKINKGEMTAKELLRDLSELMKNGQLDSQTLKDVFHTKEFKNVMDGFLRDEMFLKPEEFSKENLKKLYAKISNDADAVAKNLQGIPKTEHMIADATQVKNDVNFLNQVNQFMNYVQIPLKMTGQNTHGDLYVYRRHKNGGNEDEELKALLHLDMDHLGPMDVLVKLKEKNVSTGFKVESEEILDFIEAHIDQLNARLTALGYHVDSVVEKNDGNYSFKKNVLEEELPPAQIKRFSFDVRA